MIIWTIGYSGSGKNRTYEYLKKYIDNIILIDGDNVRKKINKELGFSDEDKLENHIRVAEMCKMFCSKDKIYYVSMMTPTKKIRENIKKIISDVNFIFIDTSINYCIDKNNKNIYNNINVSGVDSDFDIPNKNDIFYTINTYDYNNLKLYEKSIQGLVNKIHKFNI